ncbi:hypothetical protein [uncultured Intestinimonas sp.]|uniref:hypothetical protein n=1 Tax=uncultured Intestinimonas sp. TaxID=1689265 RepID=UPI0025FABCE7|nr:hypothetical protein [uncultured Intestinimonas sp.]
MWKTGEKRWGCKKNLSTGVVEKIRVFPHGEKTGKVVHREFSTFPQNPVERDEFHFPDKMDIHSYFLNKQSSSGGVCPAGAV